MSKNKKTEEDLILLAEIINDPDDSLSKILSSLLDLKQDKRSLFIAGIVNEMKKNNEDDHLINLVSILANDLIVDALKLTIKQ